MATAPTTPAPGSRPTLPESVLPVTLPPPSVTPQDIAARAYEIYREGGAEDGHDLDHWLQAERELSARGLDDLQES